MRMRYNQPMEFKIKKLNHTLAVQGIVNVHYFEFSEDFHTAADRHPFYELVYCAQGSLHIKSEDYDGMLSEHQLILHRPDELHSLVCGKNQQPTVIIVGFTCDCEALDAFSQKPVYLLPGGASALAEIVLEGRNVFLPPYNVPLLDMKKRKNAPTGSEQMLQNLLECFLLRLIRGTDISHAKHDKIQISAVEMYLQDNCNEKITIDQLAFIFNTNRSTLCSEFRRVTGKTVNEFINERRIAEAKRLLLGSDMTVTQIAGKLNFDTIHYFTRFFKHEVGVSPSEYRKKK